MNSPVLSEVPRTCSYTSGKLTVAGLKVQGLCDPDVEAGDSPWVCSSLTQSRAREGRRIMGLCKYVYVFILAVISGFST